MAASFQLISVTPNDFFTNRKVSEIIKSVTKSVTKSATIVRGRPIRGEPYRQGFSQSSVDKYKPYIKQNMFLILVECKVLLALIRAVF